LLGLPAWGTPALPPLVAAPTLTCPAPVPATTLLPPTAAFAPPAPLGFGPTADGREPALDEHAALAMNIANSFEEMRV
jgi:hypothetical protein